MKKKNYETIGEIDKNGNLRIPNDFSLFIKDNPGSRVVITIHCYDKRSVNAIRGYYFKVVLPQIVQGFYNTGVRITEKTVHEKLQEMSVAWKKPVMHDTNGIIEEEIKEPNEMKPYDWVEFIEEVKQFASENLHIYIEDGRII